MVRAQGPTTEQREGFMRWLLAEKADSIRALARTGYATDGRGAIVACVRATGARGPVPFDAELAWMSHRTATAPGGPGWPDLPTRSLIQRYDPARQFVAVFDFDGLVSAVTGRLVEAAPAAV